MTFLIPMTSDNIAFNIALGVLLLSVVLHPIVRACFYRIRADRAWKRIERREPVEVTKYGFFSEALGDRGKWDTARVVTLMIAAFHVSTWGLELTLDISIRDDGPVDLLNRPPPIVSRAGVVDLVEADWIVRRYANSVPASGSLGSVHGTLVDGNATTTYRINDEIVRGNTLFASWSPEFSQIDSGLFYGVDDGQATVDAISCIPSKEGDVYLEEDTVPWGSVTECENGPEVLNSNEDISSPPTILLNSTEGEVYLIVEEESSYPSFLYSVWTPGDSTADTAELQHVFYISSTTRLVEAVVTGIVNGHINGGSCVDLLTQYSVDYEDYNLTGSVRISPFGEHPSSSSVDRLDQVEPIVNGVCVNDIGMVFGVLLIAVTASALLGCMFSHSGRSLDVYNRDELIRAVSLPGGQGTDGAPAALKISVRQESDKAFSIVISDDGVYRGCDGIRNKLSCRRRASSISSTSRSISRSSSIPASSRELTFGGVRPTLEDSVLPALHDDNKDVARNSRAPSRTVRTVELIASPVPSPSGVDLQDTVPRDTVRAAFHGSPLRTMQMDEESETPVLEDVEALSPNTAPVELRPMHVREDVRSVQQTARQATPRVEVDVEAAAPK